MKMSRIPMVRLIATAVVSFIGLLGCMTQSYHPGPPDNPFNGLRLGQSYGDMTRTLGDPDSSRCADRAGKEAVLTAIPVWGLVEVGANMNPDSVQVYTYNRWGTITIGDGRIVRIEAK